MKALLPPFCRPMGYIVLAIAVCLPFLMYFTGRMTDDNLMFYKECAKLLLMFGALMTLLALCKDESHQTEQIRIWATRAAILLTVFFLFAQMLYHLTIRHVAYTDGSSFLIFLILNILCLEFGIEKLKLNQRNRPDS
ncbi:MAG: hypothetical protein LBM61_01665 [Prevotellaceae bacterium]|jgi:peptidoglycan/LPS O-acetylase OafA/YrhL|nr:hypothetical protein [Prevotellaceae bacterium]